MEPLQPLFGAGSLGAALHAFAVANGAPTALSDLGVKADDLDHAAEVATRSPYPNPAPLTRQGIRALLQNAYAGSAPQ